MNSTTTKLSDLYSVMENATYLENAVVSCDAPFQYLIWYDDQKQSQLLCKVCLSRFNPSAESRFAKTHVLKCPYYLHNLRKVDRLDLKNNKYRYKIHYIYREFQIDFFRMNLRSLPKNASSLKFSKFDQNIIGLCLSY